MKYNFVKLNTVLEQYRIETIVQNDILYKQVTISKNDGIQFRGYKLGREIGRKRQFLIDLNQFPNTLLFVRQGISEGGIGIANSDVNGCIATENMPMFNIININPEYLSFLLKSSYFKNEIKKMPTTGSAQKAIHEKQLLQIFIPLPTPEKQVQIVAELKKKSSISTTISNEIDSQLSLLKLLRQQILQDAIQGKLVPQDPNDEPASILLEKIKAEKEQLVKDKKIKKEKPLPPIKPEEIPFEIPDNWVWCRLGEICSKISDGFHNTPPKVATGIPYISATHIKSDKIDWQNCDYVNEHYHKELFRKATPKKGDLLLVNIGAGCGTPAVVDVDFEFSFKNSAILKLYHNSLSIRYIYYFFILSKNRIYNTLTQGGLQPFLSLKILNLINIPLPPYYEQHRIVTKINHLMKTCDDLGASIRESQGYAEDLLQVALKEVLSPNEKP